MKTIGRLMVALLLLGGLAWWFRDSIPLFGGGEAAAQAEQKLERMRDDGEPARLSGVELSSLLRYRSSGFSASGVHNPAVEMSGDTLRLAGTIPTDAIPSHPDLERVRGLLPDSARVEVSGGVRSLGDGRAALEVRQVEFAGIPIPERYYPPMLERFGRGSAQGLRPAEMPLPLPPGIRDVRVEDGHLLLIP
jgi:hypothetical protein